MRKNEGLLVGKWLAYISVFLSLPTGSDTMAGDVTPPAPWPQPPACPGGASPRANPKSNFLSVYQ